MNHLKWCFLHKARCKISHFFVLNLMFVVHDIHHIYYTQGGVIFLKMHKFIKLNIFSLPTTTQLIPWLDTSISVLPANTQKHYHWLAPQLPCDTLCEIHTTLPIPRICMYHIVKSDPRVLGNRNTGSIITRWNPMLLLLSTSSPMTPLYLPWTDSEDSGPIDS